MTPSDRIQELDRLISCVDNRILRRCLENWVQDNIVVLGHQYEITDYAMSQVPEKDRESYRNWYKKVCAMEIGKIAIDFAEVQTYPKNHAQATTFRLFVIGKPVVGGGGKSD